MTTDQIRVLIVDDERLARAHLELLVTRTALDRRWDHPDDAPAGNSRQPGRDRLRLFGLHLG